jgi:hypothetical protein
VTETVRNGCAPFSVFSTGPSDKTGHEASELGFLIGKRVFLMGKWVFLIGKGGVFDREKVVFLMEKWCFVGICFCFFIVFV